MVRMPQFTLPRFEWPELERTDSRPRRSPSRYRPRRVRRAEDPLLDTLLRRMCLMSYQPQRWGFARCKHCRGQIQHCRHWMGVSSCWVHASTGLRACQGSRGTVAEHA